MVGITSTDYTAFKIAAGCKRICQIMRQVPAYAIVVRDCYHQLAIDRAIIIAVIASLWAVGVGRVTIVAVPVVCKQDLAVIVAL